MATCTLKEQKVVPGSTVTVRYSDGRTISFTIESPIHNAALPRSGVVSVEAPIARAVLGKRVGEYGSYEAGEIMHTVTIISVH